MRVFFGTFHYTVEIDAPPKPMAMGVIGGFLFPMIVGIFLYISFLR